MFERPPLTAQEIQIIRQQMDSRIQIITSDLNGPTSNDVIRELELIRNYDESTNVSQPKIETLKGKMVFWYRRPKKNILTIDSDLKDKADHIDVLIKIFNEELDKKISELKKPLAMMQAMAKPEPESTADDDADDEASDGDELEISDSPRIQYDVSAVSKGYVPLGDQPSFESNSFSSTPANTSYGQSQAEATESNNNDCICCCDADPCCCWCPYGPFSPYNTCMLVDCNTCTTTPGICNCGGAPAACNCNCGNMDDPRACAVMCVAGMVSSAGLICCADSITQAVNHSQREGGTSWPLIKTALFITAGAIAGWFVGGLVAAKIGGLAVEAVLAVKVGGAIGFGGTTSCFARCFCNGEVSTNPSTMFGSSPRNRPTAPLASVMVDQPQDRLQYQPGVG